MFTGELGEGGASAEIFKQTMVTRNRVGIRLPYRLASEPVILNVFMESRSRFQGMNSASLCSLAGRYDNPIPTRFLAPIDCLKIPAQRLWGLGTDKE